MGESLNATATWICAQSYDWNNRPIFAFRDCPVPIAYTGAAAPRDQRDPIPPPRKRFRVLYGPHDLETMIWVDGLPNVSRRMHESYFMSIEDITEREAARERAALSQDNPASAYVYAQRPHFNGIEYSFFARELTNCKYFPNGTERPYGPLTEHETAYLAEAQTLRTFLYRKALRWTEEYGELFVYHPLAINSPSVGTSTTENEERNIHNENTVDGNVTPLTPEIQPPAQAPAAKAAAEQAEEVVLDESSDENLEKHLQQEAKEQQPQSPGSANAEASPISPSEEQFPHVATAESLRVPQHRFLAQTFFYGKGSRTRHCTRMLAAMQSESILLTGNLLEYYFSHHQMWSKLMFEMAMIPRVPHDKVIELLIHDHRDQLQRLNDLMYRDNKQYAISTLEEVTGIVEQFTLSLIHI